MTQYYILEIQQYTNGEFGHIVHFAYDENDTMARLEAESKYHSVLASAAVSELPQHSASLITSNGMCIMNQCYTHEMPAPEPEPIPDPEPDVEPEPEPEGGNEGEE